MFSFMLALSAMNCKYNRLKLNISKMLHLIDSTKEPVFHVSRLYILSFCHSAIASLSNV